MTISTTDLKIFQSQRNRDTADGGGAMSPNEVVDGELNNVFDDISSEDRVGGRVSIRKVFPGVFSDDTERFFGAGLLIINPAIDPAVDVLMTRNTAYDDERSDAAARIETFMTPAGNLLWRLFNNHLEGTASLTMYALGQAPTPNLGDTLFLEDADDSSVREAVRISEIVSRNTQTFVDSQGTFQRDVLVVELTRPLQNDWDGTEVFRQTTTSTPTLIRDSTVSAGAEYFGVKQLTEDVTQGDLTIQVDNPFARIVPTTSAETPVSDERASLAELSFAKAGDDSAINVSTGSFSVDAGVPETVHLGGTVFPGSVEISGTFTATDNGDGTLAIDGSDITATVDYDTGAITITKNSFGNLNLTLVATPGAAVQDSTLTIQIPVQDQTRRLNYVRTLRPLPAPGSVNVDYRSLNNWFRLSDDGNGSLAGQQAGEGGGTINYATGSVTATLGAQPDLGTSIIFSWGTGAILSDGSKTLGSGAATFSFTIPDAPMKPGSLEMSYPSDGQTVNLTTNTAGEVLDGVDVIGVYVPVNGTVSMTTPQGKWPDAGATLSYTVDTDVSEQETFQPSPSGSSDQITFTLANPPVEPGTIELEWLVDAVVNDRLRTFELHAFDDGNGSLVYANGKAVPGSTIDYQTGEITMPAALEVTS